MSPESKRGERLAAARATKTKPEEAKPEETKPEAVKATAPKAVVDVLRKNTEIRKCSNADCKSRFQDKTYGKGIRVHNLMGASRGAASVTGYRCTVCLKETLRGK